MRKITISEFFNLLNAPLFHRVRSWGSINKKSGDVIFRIWDDEHIKGEGVSKRKYRLTDYALYADKLSDFGFQERLEHIEIANNKGRAFFIICYATDKTVQPRSIRTFKREFIGFSASLVRVDLDWWLEDKGLITVAEYQELTA